MVNYFYSNEEKNDILKSYMSCQKNAKLALQEYRRKFPVRHVPHYTYIKLIYNKLKNTGTLVRKNKIIPRFVLTENLQEMLLSFQEHPTHSIKDASRHLEMSWSSVQTVLSIHQYKPYCYRPVQNISENDTHRRMQFCRLILNRNDQNDNFLDRTVFLWDTKDFTQKDRKSLRVNIEFDYATFVKWSPDSKAFVIHRYNENCIEVYKVEKKKDGWLAAIKALTFPKHHTTDVIGAAIASNGKFIMTCSNKTDLIIWDLKGEKMATVDTCLMTTTCAKISPCGRFVVASGFTPEAKVWEVSFTKSGEFQDVKPVVSLTLGGHTSGVYDVAFDVDSSHMATVSKDGTWRLFDTKVNYKQGQDARLEKSEKYELSGSHSLIALSPNAEVIVIAASNSLAFYSTHSGKLDNTIEDAFEDDITAILFDASGKYFLASGDKHIKVFHNVTGYRCAIETAKEKLKEHQTSATKERLQQLISDSQAFLEKIGEK